MMLRLGACVVLCTVLGCAKNSGTKPLAAAEGPTVAATPTPAPAPPTESASEVPAEGSEEDPADKAMRVGEKLLSEERFGTVGLGVSGPALVKALGSKVKKGKVQEWGADGAFHQSWFFSEHDLEVDMSAEEKKGAYSAESMMIKSKSKLKSARGIGIGASRDEVEKAYGDLRNPEDSDSDAFVAGSVYAGLIFSFDEAGRVKAMFLGAAAE